MQGPFWLDNDSIGFPPPHLADKDGLLGVAGDLRPRRLLNAYALGIFPWYSEGSPILWWSPDPRFVLRPEELHVGRTLRQTMRKRRYKITFDLAFREVMTRCGEVPREDQDGTWITDEMLDAYAQLHTMGFAHSIEAWKDDTLVGGLYGVCLGDCFFGESMFALAPDASKEAFVWATRQMQTWGIELVDCQMETDHLARFGAKAIPRETFLETLNPLVTRPTRRGKWSFDERFDGCLKTQAPEQV